MNLYERIVAKVSLDMFLAATSVIIISALLEVAVPGFVTSIIDLRWFFVLMVVSFAVALVTQDRGDLARDTLQRIFIICTCLAATLLIGLIVALQGSSVLIRLALVLLVIFSILILVILKRNDSRRSH